MDASSARLAGQHILLAAEYLHFGGTRTYLLRLLDLYYRHGAKVTLVSTLQASDPSMCEFLEQRGFGFITFVEAMAVGDFRRKPGHPTVWSWREYLREREAFRAFASRICATRSVVSVGSAGLMLSAAAALPDPIVIAHGYPHGRRQELLGRWYLTRFIPPRTTFITVSNYERRIIERMWDLSHSRSCAVTVLSTDGELAASQSTQDPPWLVVEPYKRPHDWIAVANEVIGSLPVGSVEFKWIGEGSLRQAAQADAAAQPHSDFIHFPGLCLDPEPYYERARVYLQLSSIENLSLSTLDAQRHGIPCVVTDTGGFPEIIADGVNGFVVLCGDVARAAEAVTRLLRDEDLWQAQSAASAESYARRHSPQTWEAAMLAAHKVPG